MGLDRAFLSLLNARPVLESYAGGDTWGNDTWAAGTPIAAFVEGIEVAKGTDDGQGKQEREAVGTVSMICDYYAIKPKDRVTLPSGRVVHVTAATTEHDEVGAPLYQTVQMSTEAKG